MVVLILEKTNQSVSFDIYYVSMYMQMNMVSMEMTDLTMSPAVMSRIFLDLVTALFGHPVLYLQTSWLHPSDLLHTNLFIPSPFLFRQQTCFQGCCIPVVWCPYKSSLCPLPDWQTQWCTVFIHLFLYSKLSLKISKHGLPDNTKEAITLSANEMSMKP